MKKLNLSFLALAGFIFLSANFTDFKPNSQSAYLDPEEPVLPEVPFNYDISFPQHIIFSSWGLIDSAFINSMITPEGATLGRVLFYDKHLSGSNEVACASCHKQEFSFADNNKFSEGIDGQIGTRNSPNINDLGWGGSAQLYQTFFWDGREENIFEMVLQPIGHEGELGKNLDLLPSKLKELEYYPALFQEAFGSNEITKDRIVNALVQFLISMVTFNSRYDQYLDGEATLTSLETDGLALFEQSCALLCHSAHLFGSDIGVMNNGLDSVYEDQGAAEWTGSDFDIGKFKSPSLRNIELTSPYMHDGRFQTLEEVVDFYSEHVYPHENSEFMWIMGPGFTGFQFTQYEKDALIAFMKTLTDESFTTNPIWSDPFQTVNGDHSLPLDEKVNIFPNPFSESAWVKFDNSSNETYTLRLTSLNERVLKTFETKDKLIEIKKDNLLGKGVYLLEIRKGDLKKTERIVLQ